MEAHSKDITAPSTAPLPSIFVSVFQNAAVGGVGLRAGGELTL